MAKPKKASLPIKVMDVSHPDTSAASTNSKQVIVGNRPLMKDPMVVEVKTHDEVASQESDNKQVTKDDNLTPENTLTAPILDKENIDPIEVDSTTATEVKPEEPKDKAVVVSEVKEDEFKSEENITPKPDTLLNHLNSAPELKPDENKDEENKPEVKDTVEPPKEEINQPAVIDKPKTADTESAEKDELKEEVKPAESTDGNNKDAQSSEESVEELEAKEAAEKVEHDEAIDKLVESKQYYLPINTVEKRRSRRFVLLGILLSILMIVAWADIALDAGLINLSANIPHTHFFSASPSSASGVTPSQTQTANTSSTSSSTIDPTAATQLHDVQTLLESYFASNNSYPSDLTPAPLVNQPGLNSQSSSTLTPKSGTKFVYAAFPSNCTTALKNCIRYNLKIETTAGKILDSLHSLN